VGFIDLGFVLLLRKPINPIRSLSLVRGKLSLVLQDIPEEHLMASLRTCKIATGQSLPICA
jgi:hypothetical protein